MSFKGLKVILTNWRLSKSYWFIITVELVPLEFKKVMPSRPLYLLCDLRQRCMLYKWRWGACVCLTEMGLVFWRVPCLSGCLPSFLPSSAPAVVYLPLHFLKFLSLFVRSFNHWKVSNTPCHVELYSSWRLLITLLRNNFCDKFCWDFGSSLQVSETVSVKFHIHHCWVDAFGPWTQNLRNVINSRLISFKIKIREE